MTDDDIQKHVDSDEPNVPQRQPMVTSGGARKYVPPEERRKRRETLSRLMASGMSDDRIMQAMTAVTIKGPDGEPVPGFGMTENAVEKMMDEIFEGWADEDRRRNSHLKAAARRRIYDHIDRAGRAGKWTAVAALEKTLSTIEGTIETTDLPVDNDRRVADSLLVVLGNMNTGDIRRLIEKERNLLNEGPPSLPGGTTS